jgi:hypothetical protein
LPGFGRKWREGFGIGVGGKGNEVDRNKEAQLLV